jgi:hypothetical protein
VKSGQPGVVTAVTLSDAEAFWLFGASSLRTNKLVAAEVCPTCSELKVCVAGIGNTLSCAVVDSFGRAWHPTTPNNNNTQNLTLQNL